MGVYDEDPEENKRLEELQEHEKQAKAEMSDDRT
jgi:hypothetical protein